jgi:hypothetical protein
MRLRGEKPKEVMTMLVYGARSVAHPYKLKLYPIRGNKITHYNIHPASLAA